MRNRSVALALCLAVAATDATAQHSKRDVTLEDLLSLRGITGIAISPDGKQIAYRLDNDLYLVEASAKGSPRKLTTGLAPSFSPDSRELAYYAGGDRTTQLWILDLRSGTSKVLTNAEGGLIPLSPPGF